MPVGVDVSVTLRVEPQARWLVHGAEVLVGQTSPDNSELSWRAIPLDACEAGFEGVIELARMPHVVFYAFALQVKSGNVGDEDADANSVLYYVPCVDGRSTAGELVRPGVDGEWNQAGWVNAGHRLAQRPGGDFGLPWPLPGFQISVYAPDFATPDWLAGAVMYQVFPDRFARGPRGPLPEGLAYHERMNRPVRLHGSWDELMEWQGQDGEPFDPVDFFGGTLAGIMEKLPYLASLGVEVLYLNPVFEARSNHRYDTADYERIDPLLGTEDDFRVLAAEARKLGIRVVLDAVLSHTGDDSRYFNANGNYDAVGAAQGPASPFFAWYTFYDAPQEETGVNYQSWWGFPSLPEVDERDPAWQSYVLGDLDGASGVLPSWLAKGAGGYRLDVADEIPDDVLSRLRASVKRVDPDAAIIGEVWEDATTKVSYGQHRGYALGTSLDSVMNYPLRAVLISFALGWVDAHQLAAFLKQQQANYPQPLYRCLMNLLSSHDVERIRGVLAAGGPIKHLPRDEQLEIMANVTPTQDARAAQLQRLIAGILYALPGAPCLYYGDERGLRSGGDPFCRATFPWAGSRADQGGDLTEYYQQLGQRRKQSPALRQGLFACTAPTPNVLCIIRATPDARELVAAIANRTNESRSFALDLKALFGPTFALIGEDGLVHLASPPNATTFKNLA